MLHQHASAQQHQIQSSKFHTYSFFLLFMFVCRVNKCAYYINFAENAQFIRLFLFLFWFNIVGVTSRVINSNLRRISLLTTVKNQIFCTLICVYYSRERVLYFKYVKISRFWLTAYVYYLTWLIGSKKFCLKKARTNCLYLWKFFAYCCVVVFLFDLSLLLHLSLN